MNNDKRLGPDIICFGAQKGGTRWLYDQLAFHPDVWMPPVKELHYFDHTDPAKRAAIAERVEIRLKRRRRRYEKQPDRSIADGYVPFEPRDIAFAASYVEAMRREPDLDSYARLFKDKGAQITGDVTPDYCVLEASTIAGLAGRFPDAKAVFLARDPIERFWSAFCMASRRGSSAIPATLTPEAIVAFANQPGVAARSSPADSVQRWRSHFPSGNVGVFFFDDVRVNPADVRRQMLNFIGLNPDAPSGPLPPDYNRKENQEKIEMTPEIRSALIDHFSDELWRCAEELGGAATSWPAKYFETSAASA